MTYSFKETEINFFISHEKDVIANASEMAISFNKKPNDFLKLKETENFIQLLLDKLNSENEIVSYKHSDIVYSKDGSTYMHRKLAIKFAFWLDDEFEIWFFEIVDDILFGNYKKHWDAHVIQKSSQFKMQELKKKLLLKSPTKEDVHAYFKAEKEFVNARMAKLRAIKDQYSFDLDFGE
ncbi:KilA-N domain-containing protein [Flavobacterium pallidum]|uniref:KilA-N domain-containing protein n=1 Tax=Flavobacterium pallidum TaxID=2172098 RepID=A0A2S1SKC9_9FLAO|nr:KilA-N domain-containing protein [Flavobacterium pallidum]AWI26855.1 hypothetical protein HYN49_13620 [Flavobacterium pallidum]